MIKISHTNSKLGEIPTISLPAIKTCRIDAPCGKTKKCYGCKGRLAFANAINSFEHNLEEYTDDDNFYFLQIQHYLKNKIVNYKYFRWHVVGDIVDDNYFAGMIETANRVPNVKFLCFTKKYEIVNNYILLGGVIPKNLKIIFSAWGRYLTPINPYNLPVAYIKFNSDEETGYIPSKAKHCQGNCTTCLDCWSLKNGESVVFKKH